MNQFRQFLKGFIKGFKDFGENMADLINMLILLLVYVLGVGLSALLVRFLRKDLLDRAPSLAKKTYWVPLDLKQNEVENYYRQF